MQGCKWAGGMIAVALVAAWAVGLRVQAAEHPEHPTAAPEKTERQPLTKNQLADSIESYIQEDTELKGGYFLFYDRRDKKVLKLKLDHVHRERVSHTGSEVYFACSDLREHGTEKGEGSQTRAALKEKGTLYDMDFWMKRDEDGDLHVTKIMVHKVAGKPRYEWYEVGGVWKQQPVSPTSMEPKQPKKPEHPEHPK